MRARRALERHGRSGRARPPLVRRPTLRIPRDARRYGVKLLLSGEMHAMLSDETRSRCRLLDHVTVKGSSHPVRLYTYDYASAVPPALDYPAYKRQFEGALAKIHVGICTEAHMEFSWWGTPQTTTPAPARSCRAACSAAPPC